MVVIAVVCVVGIVGGLASTLSYDQLYGQDPRRLEPPLRPVRPRRSRRRSRQLRAVEAALASAEAHPAPGHEPRGRRP
jgi:hypothetical protein